MEETNKVSDDISVKVKIKILKKKVDALNLYYHYIHELWIPPKHESIHTPNGWSLERVAPLWVEWKRLTKKYKKAAKIHYEDISKMKREEVYALIQELKSELMELGVTDDHYKG